MPLRLLLLCSLTLTGWSTTFRVSAQVSLPQAGSMTGVVVPDADGVTSTEPLSPELTALRQSVRRCLAHYLLQADEGRAGA